MAARVISEIIIDQKGFIGAYPTGRHSMGLTRRKLLACTALPGVVLGTSGCLSQGGPLSGFSSSKQEAKVKFDGNVSTEEPLTENAEISPESPYPNHYSSVIHSKGAADVIRWEYVQEELPQLVDDLEATNFDAESLLFFGMVLPETKQLQSEGVSIDESTLRSTYRIGSDRSASRSLSIHTHIHRVKMEDHPDDVSFEVRF